MTRQSDKPSPKLHLDPTQESFRQLVEQHQRGALAWDGSHVPYQRGRVWTLDQKIALVQSVLLGIPIPAIIANHRGYGGGPVRVVIDGQQRLTTMHEWFAGEFMVPASWFRPQDVLKPVDVSGFEEYADTGSYVAFYGLEEDVRWRFWLATVSVATGHLKSIKAEAMVYLRVNGYGTQQTDDDMARARRVAEGK